MDAINTKPCLVSRVCCYSVVLVLLDNADVRCVEALGTFFDFELHVVAFIQALVAACRNRIKVDEYIFAACACDETETFCCIEPFDSSFFHGTIPFY